MNPKLSIDPEFEAKCPPLTEDELSQVVGGVDWASLPGLDYTVEYDKDPDREVERPIDAGDYNVKIRP